MRTGIYIFSVLYIIGLLSSCGTSQFVREGESLLERKKINIIDDKNVKDEVKLKLELNSFVKQQPNTNFFWLWPREYFYFKNSASGDSSWYNNWLRESIGEPPVFYSKDDTEASSFAMEKFLKNNKGFYEASVDYEAKLSGHKTSVEYNVTTGPQYTVNKLEYVSKDKSLLRVLEGISSESLIKPGDPLDNIQFNLEKTRIVTELQEKGYAYFAPNYIELVGDSTNLEHAWDVYFNIYPPLPDTIHRQYTIGEINVYTDFHNGQDQHVTYSELVNGVNFHRESKDFIVKPSLLRDKIFLDQGLLLSRNNRLKTRRKLDDLGTYRFIQVNQSKDPIVDSLINFDIYLTPQEHLWIMDAGFDFTYSSGANQVQRPLFGIAGNMRLTNRNFFGGAEQNTISIDNGYEFNLDAQNLNNFNLGISDQLTIPKFIDFLGLAKLSNKLGIFGNESYENYRDEAETNFSIGFNITDILDFYRISTFNTSLSYTYAPNNNSRYNLKQTGFSLNNYNLDSLFLDRFEDNPLVIASFEDNFTTGFLFNEFSYFYNSTPKRSGTTYGFFGFFESSGFETYVVNKAYNTISGNDNVWKLSNNIAFSKFIKTEVDFRLYHKLNEKQSWAFRINTGIAVPFAEQEAVPFVKQFSVGGPSSMRAWDQKELGPGSYLDPLTIEEENTGIFFQQGDFKLELNAEYRFDVVWLLEGAFFVDIGNVWTLKPDSQRPGSVLTSNFYEQLAIGAGWGARWDFNYFNVRFDLGYRIRNNFPDEDEGYFLSWREIRQQGFGNLQVAVNYPF